MSVGTFQTLKALQGLPKGLPGSPKGLPGAPKELPGAPKGSQGLPEVPRESLKGPQKDLEGRAHLKVVGWLDRAPPNHFQTASNRKMVVEPLKTKEN